MKFIIAISMFLLSCSIQHNTHPQTTSRYYYILGDFYGHFSSIKYETIGGTGDIYEYIFDKEKNMVTCKANGKSDLYIYYDNNNLLDSVIDIKSIPERTTYFYKTRYKENFPKYSIENGFPLDFISRNFDSANHKVQFIYNGKISSVDSFDVNDNLIKRVLVDANTFETYSYDAYGSLKNVFINTKINNKDSLFNVVTYDYEYDTNNNWTKRTLKKNYPNGNQFTTTTKRIINY